MPSNVVLVGPMGAGKTTVGKQLATRLAYSFTDTDHVIEARSGADIPWIFDVEGEAGFRQRETAALQSMLDLKEHVIATGGGIVVTPVNLECLSSLGKVFYLTASIDQLMARTSKDKKRPLLQTENPRRKIEELIQQRDHLYRQVADHTITTDGRATKWVVQKICDLM